MKLIIVLVLFSSVAFAQQAKNSDKTVQAISQSILEDEKLDINLKQCAKLKSDKGMDCAKAAIENHKKAVAALGISHEKVEKDEPAQKQPKKWLLAHAPPSLKAKKQDTSLDNCEMSSDHKEISCGEKVYVLSGKVNSADRIMDKLDNSKPNAPAHKAGKASAQ